MAELAENHDVSDAVFLIDDETEFASALRREGFDYLIEIYGLRTRIERIVREVEPRTSSFSNCFSHVDPPTAEVWL